MRRKIGLTMLVSAVLLTGLLWLPIPTQVMQYTASPSGWSFLLTAPLFFRSTDGGILSLQVTPPKSSGPAIITARLDLGDMQIENSEAGETTASGGSAHFSWEIPGANPGLYEGRIWVYDGLDRTVINARSLKLRILQPGPVLLWVLRFLAIGFTVGGGVLAWLRPAVRRRN